MESAPRLNSRFETERKNRRTSPPDLQPLSRPEFYTFPAFGTRKSCSSGTISRQFLGDQILNSAPGCETPDHLCYSASWEIVPSRSGDSRLAGTRLWIDFPPRSVMFKLQPEVLQNNNQVLQNNNNNKQLQKFRFFLLRASETSDDQTQTETLRCVGSPSSGPRLPFSLYC